jgi:hypothetical protein
MPHPKCDQLTHEQASASSLQDLAGKRVSVLITGKDGKIENYIGILKSSDAQWIVLDFSEVNPEWFLTEIRFRPAILESIWVYRNKSWQDDKKPSSKTATEMQHEYAMTEINS